MIDPVDKRVGEFIRAPLKSYQRVPKIRECRAEGGIGMAKATAARRSALHRAAATGRALPPAVAQGDGTKRDADALLDQLLVFALAHHP